MKPNLKPVKRTSEKKKEKEAIFQYLIDHAVWSGNYWQSTIHFKDEKDFFWRTQSRMFGVKRNDEEEAKKEYEIYKTNQHYIQRMSKKMSKIDIKGTLLQKLMLFTYRKSRDYIKRL